MLCLVSGCGGEADSGDGGTSTGDSDTGIDDGSDDGSDGGSDDDGSTTTELTYAIVDTNQTDCYDTDTGATLSSCSDEGQDGSYSGAQPDYTDNGDYTVTDNHTGLTWQQDPDTDGDGDVDYDDQMGQSDAETYCENLTLGAYSDWRLPDTKTLYSLMDFSGTDASNYTGTDTSALTPFIDDTYFVPAFGDTGAGDRIIDGQFAAATNSVVDGAMFGVNFVDGRIKGYHNPDINTYYVRCVRGNPDYGVNAFTDNGDGTVSDAATGLMWYQDDYHSTDFDDALSYCENDATAGYDDWRLPNVKELHSIVDYNYAPDYNGSPAIDPLFNATSFTNEGGREDWAYYWASTAHLTLAAKGNYATYISFGRALGYYDPNKDGTYEVVDVHGAGAQRSNDKNDNNVGTTITVDGVTFQYHGPQGDILRFDNRVRCVRDDID